MMKNQQNDRKQYPEKLMEVTFKNNDLENQNLKQLEYASGRKKDSLFLYTTAITANLLIFACGSGFGWTSPVVPLLKKSNPAVNPLGRPITPLEESWIASLYCLGAAIGPLFAAKLADHLGRKKALLTFAIPKLICLLILSFATDIKIYYATRLSMGLVVGSVFAIVPMYLAEISQTHNKGRIGSLMVVFLTSGVFYVFLIGPFLSVKVLTFSCAVPVMIFLVFFGLFIPESPVYLVGQGKTEEAAEALMKLRNKRQSQVQEELRKISDAIKSEHEGKGRGVMDLFTDRGLRKALLVSLVLLMSQQFSGINAVIAFLEPIFEASGTSISAYVSTNLIGFVQVVSTIFTAVIVEKLGRKVLLLVSTIGTSISMALLGLYFHLQDDNVFDVELIFWLPIISLISFVILFSLGLSGLPWTITSEIFPSNIMPLALSLASFSCFLSSFLVTLGFPILLESHGMGKCFWLFSGCMMLSTCFIYYLVPETKGKTSAELQEILRK
ncbi:hypothetical protein JTB14_004060 [Gonioctena quinquepunctata]|nr:hypothetical protein JTB14_004060 [Gonioctena quinquepunctata]